MTAPSAPLPIDAVLDAVAERLRTDGVVVVTAPPGTGKTTRVPLALWRAGLADDGCIVVLEPRRVAARACATYMAASLGEPVGRTVGYQMRHEAARSDATRVLVVTEGVLTAWFASDPLLSGVSCIVADEFHERSVHVDLALAFAKEARTVRDDLRVAVMSATLETDAVCAYLGAAAIGVEAPVHPLTIRYAPPKDASHPDPVHAAHIVRRAVREDKGDILVFLPGAAAISQCHGALADLREVEVLPLFAALPRHEQDRALAPCDSRKVVLATDIAETSLTVPGVRVVVDSGWHRIPQSTSYGVDVLTTKKTSIASCVQRAGRAHREGPGVVYRLWDPRTEKERPAFDEPEIRRVDLARPILQLLAVAPGDPAAFDWLTPPPAGACAQAVDLLRTLGMVHQDGYGLTEKGRWCLRCGVHPRAANVAFWSAAAGDWERGTLAAAVLEEEEVLESPPDAPESEAVSTRADRLLAWKRRGAQPDQAAALGLRYWPARRALETAARIARTQPPVAAVRGDMPLAVAAGFPDRIARRAPAGDGMAPLSGGGAVHLPPGVPDTVAAIRTRWRSDATGRRPQVWWYAPVDREQLETFFPGGFSEHRHTFVDDDGTARTERRVVFGRLTWEAHSAPLDKPAAAAALAQAARARWHTAVAPLIADDPTVVRLRVARRIQPEGDWPAVDDDALSARLETWLQGATALSDLAALPLRDLLLGELDWEQRRWLDTHLPPAVTLPTGTVAPVNYAPVLEGGLPKVRARLQEVMGPHAPQAVAQGRLRLCWELLSPAGRPIQVTADLPGFWAGSYDLVRKEMAARYPKHPWPENPLEAVPTKGAKPKKRR